MNSSVEQLNNARIIFPTRVGGKSLAPYDSLNIATHVGDEPAAVHANREHLRSTLAKTNTNIAWVDEWIFLNQTHEHNIYYADEDVYYSHTPPAADASITQQKNLPLVVMTADCGPLVIAGQSILGVVHASWRTVSLGLISTVINEMKKRTPNEDFSAMLGPCIHPENYEFDPDDLHVLATKLGDHVKSTTYADKPALDLPAAIAHECEISNVPLTDVDIDTYASSEYFSYRRDRVTGRQGVIAWIQ